VAHFVHKVLSVINIAQTAISSDNEAVIQWVRNDNSNIAYVRNRVAEIKELSDNYQIFHVPSEENPADFVT
ncbi:hypothetical protein SK128_017749, partial [Halocaridina rubra]